MAWQAARLVTWAMSVGAFLVGAGALQHPPFAELDPHCHTDADALLSAGPNVHGLVHKTGMPDPTQWIQNCELLYPTYRSWMVSNALFLNGAAMSRPPICAPCPILINYEYKYIWIKTTKTAGTSMLQHLTQNAGICEDQPVSKPGCIHRGDRLPDLEVAAQVWAEYFVFAVARNPFDRAASSYDYTLGRRKVPNEGACKHPTFEQFTQRPYVVGLQNDAYDCLPEKLHDYAHVEPQSTCMVAQDGGSAVDFIIRYEALVEDFQRAIDIINERRDPSLPPLEPASGMAWTQKGPLLRSAGGGLPVQNRHTSKYQECGPICAKNVATYYKEDVSLFQYPRC